MESRDQETTESLSLTLKTPESAADAAAVSSMLRAIVVLVDESQQQLASEAQIALRVHPFKEGSLEIPIQVLVYGAAATLFSFNPQVAKLLETIKTFFEVKKFLKGEPTDEKTVADGLSFGDITIHGGNNVFNIIQDRRVEDALDRASTDLENDPNVTGVKLFNNSSGEEIADISREEFSYFRKPTENSVTQAPTDRIRTVNTTLTIHSPVLQGSAKWKFVYEGKQIQVSIKDQGFLAKVSGGIEAFRNGDRLKVDLEIGERFIPAICDYERTNYYAVTKVHQHVPRPLSPKQKTLFSDNT